jgi:DNA-binding NarL/FixJ family response regulator
MIRIIIVEDHEVVRDALAALFREAGGIDVVAVASSIRDAMPLLEQNHPDVVLADLALEDGSGLELLRVTRRYQLNARVVIITGFRDAFAASAALADGAAGYILKSQSAAEVVEAIRSAARGDSQVAPEISAKLSEQHAGAQPANTGRGAPRTLSRREHEVFLQLLDGYGTKEIARRLCITTKTVETHRNRMNRKLGLRNAADLIRFAVAQGLPVAPRVPADGPAARKTAW